MNRMSSARRNLVLTLLAVAVAAGSAVAQAAPAPRVIKIKGLDSMKYDVTRITAKPNELLEVELTAVSSMPKDQMSHDFVLLAKGTDVDSFVMEAAMARDSDYIPASKKQFVLASTTLAGGGETVKVTFHAPKEPGDYLYICTFPGHYMAGMKGTLVVK